MLSTVKVSHEALGWLKNSTTAASMSNSASYNNKGLQYKLLSLSAIALVASFCSCTYCFPTIWTIMPLWRLYNVLSSRVSFNRTLLLLYKSFTLHFHALKCQLFRNTSVSMNSPRYFTIVRLSQKKLTMSGCRGGRDWHCDAKDPFL